MVGEEEPAGILESLNFQIKIYIYIIVSGTDQYPLLILYTSM